jgi:hypothetical protein
MRVQPSRKDGGAWGARARTEEKFTEEATIGKVFDLQRESADDDGRP